MMQSGRWLLAMALICMVALLVISCDKETSEETPIETTKVTLFVSLDEEFVLHKNQSAVIEGEDFIITIKEFYLPPSDGTEIRRGGDIGFEYYHAGEVIKGIMLVQAFGYKTTIVDNDTDYKTFARLKVTKIS